MVFICIKNKDGLTTIGNKYELIQYGWLDNTSQCNLRYYYVADNGAITTIYGLEMESMEYFITVEQHRENQLNQIMY